MMKVNLDTGKVINQETGEVISEKSKVFDISSALKEVTFKMKELEVIEKFLKEFLKPHILKAYENGDKVLADYWVVQKGRVMFDKELFKKTATLDQQQEYDGLKKLIENIENSYRKASDPFIKVPRLG
jgi:hypothetical protein